MKWTATYQVRDVISKSGRRGIPSMPLFTFSLVLLLVVHSANGHTGGPTVVNTFRCLEVEALTPLNAEALIVQKPQCKFQVDSLNSENYSYSRYGELQYKFSNQISADDQSTIKECFSNSTSSGYWLLSFENRSIRFDTFLVAKCSPVDTAKCGFATIDLPFQVIETFQFSMQGGNCPILISIVHDYSHVCEHAKHERFCTADRAVRYNGKEEWFYPSCRNEPKIEVFVDILYRHPVTLEPMRKSAPYKGAAIEWKHNDAKFQDHSLLCDSLTIESMALLPELVDHDLRLLVLFTFVVKNEYNNWTYTTLIRVVNLLRDQHELHLQSCNETNNPDPLTFYYPNSTKFAKTAGYLDVQFPEYIDYYSINFWKHSWRLEDQVHEIAQYASYSGNKVTVGSGAWKDSACEILLNHNKTKSQNRLEKLALVLQFNVSTALSRNVTRNWTVSVMFAYLMDIETKPSKQIKCSPAGGLKPATSQLRVKISEKYHSHYGQARHVWRPKYSAEGRYPFFIVENNEEQFGIDAQEPWIPWLTEIEIAVQNTSIHRASGPQYQRYIVITLNVSRICDYLWLSELDKYGNVSVVTFHISQDLYRTGAEGVISDVAHLTTPNFWTEKRVVRAFESDDMLYEASCDSNETWTYWKNERLVNASAVTIDALRFPYAPYYTWHFGKNYGLHSAVLSIAGEKVESYFNPSDSIDLKKTKLQLCTLLEHLPVSALGLNYVPSGNASANLSLEYDATARVCSQVGSKCQDERVGIRLQLVQTTVKPWLFRKIDCSNVHDGGHRLKFDVREIDSEIIVADFTMDKVEVDYVSCAMNKIAGATRWDTAGFARYFSPDACPALPQSFTHFLRWEYQVNSSSTSPDHWLVVTNLSQTCRMLSKELSNSKVFMKVSFLMQSEEQYRAILLDIDYEPRVSPIPDDAASYAKKKTQMQEKLGDIDETEQEPDLDDDRQFYKIMFSCLLALILMTCLLASLHYAYVTFRRKSNNGREIAGVCQYVIAEQMANCPVTVLPPENKVNSSDSMPMERVMQRDETNQNYERNEALHLVTDETDEFDTWEDRVFGFGKVVRKHNTLPNKRHVYFSFNRSNMVSPKPLDEDEKLNCNREHLKAQTLSTLDLDLNNNPAPRDEPSNFSLECIDLPLSSGSSHSFGSIRECSSSYIFTHNPEDE